MRDLKVSSLLETGRQAFAGIHQKSSVQNTQSLKFILKNLDRSSLKLSSLLRRAKNKRRSYQLVPVETRSQPHGKA